MPAQLPLGLRLPASARLDNFIAGDNAGVLAAVEQLTRATEAASMYLHAPRTAGKTHLLQAACRQVQTQSAQAAYLPLPDLLTHTPACLEGLEHFALLALDDIDVCAGDAHWEEALFHLYNRLQAGGGRWLAAARQAPEAAGFGLADLRTRLAWGGVFALQQPTDAAALEIVRQRAAERGLQMPDEVLRYLHQHCERSLTALLTVLDQLDAAALQAQRRLTLPFVRSVLAQLHKV